MRVYALIPACNQFCSLAPRSPDGWEAIRALDGTRASSHVRSMAFRLLQPTGKRRAPVGDCADLTSNVPVFSQRAITALGDRLRACAELVPISCLDAEGLSLVNVTDVRPALDLDASEVERFDDGRLMDVTRHVFKPAVVAGAYLFKVPEMTWSWVYATEEFVADVAAAGLEGFGFELMWEG
jgi:hypothetical protein